MNADDHTGTDRGVDPAFITALTTEHFTLQGARAATTTESTSRSSLYVGAASSTLIALGFVAQISRVGDVFLTFALTVLPALFVLGAFTWLRVLESAVEDLRFGRAENRIRHFYREIDPALGHYFARSSYDDRTGVTGDMGFGPAPAWVALTPAASVIGLINAVVGGAAVALGVVAAGGGRPAWLAAGVLAGAAWWAMTIAAQVRRLAGREPAEALFPSPPAPGRRVLRGER